MSSTWDRPSPRAAELISAAAARILDLSEAIYQQVDDAVLEQGQIPEMRSDPMLHAALGRMSRSNVSHWLVSNVHDPGRPVTSNPGPETIMIARDLVRRGLDDAALQSYRIGHNAAWRLWMGVVFELTSDTAELKEVLDVTAASIATFIDAQIAQITEQIQAERDELTRGTHADRREVVGLLLDGAPISIERAQARLGYQLDQTHTAVAIWSDAPQVDLAELERALQTITVGTGATGRPLSIIASAAVLWAWIPGGALPNTAQLAKSLGPGDATRVAIGRTAHGVEGFRISHLDALAAQRLMVRGPDSVRVASHHEVRLATLVTDDETRVGAFVQETLGALAAAPEELRSTVLTYISCGLNAARTAELMHTHRNTIVRRLARADEMLPQSLASDFVAIAVALEVAHWRNG